MNLRTEATLWFHKSLVWQQWWLQHPQAQKEYWRFGEFLCTLRAEGEYIGKTVNNFNYNQDLHAYANILKVGLMADNYGQYIIDWPVKEEHKRQEQGEQL
jgi:hypothetical protein